MARAEGGLAELVCLAVYMLHGVDLRMLRDGDIRGTRRDGPTIDAHRSSGARSRLGVGWTVDDEDWERAPMKRSSSRRRTSQRTQAMNIYKTRYGRLIDRLVDRRETARSVHRRGKRMMGGCGDLGTSVSHRLALCRCDSDRRERSFARFDRWEWSRTEFNDLQSGRRRGFIRTQISRKNAATPNATIPLPRLGSPSGKSGSVSGRGTDRLSRTAINARLAAILRSLG